MDIRSGFVSLSVEMWRLIKNLDRMVDRLPLDSQERSHAQLRYSAGRLTAILEESGLELVSYDGREFEPNLPVSVVNLEEVAGAGQLFIEQTLEPTILVDGRVMHLGSVVLKGQE